jgi:hypothetical protein
LRVPRPRPAETTVDYSLLDACRRELEVAGRLDSWQGQGLLVLAEALCAAPQARSGLAALSKELRAARAEALQGAVASGDPVDELKARRDRIRGGS